ncbi:MAG: purine-nucleoside phosphorylase [Saprospiraceae bacterium]|nr:purine-nucleoside phosphorylase [Saprospiraceae bacterium]MBP6569185.1 purine-nucleoside phosphorylase [Saprospiraceae bacterium]
MISLFDKIQESKTYIERILIPEAKISVVLGTGLGDFAQSLTDIIEIPYSEIPHFPVSTVASHQGKMVFGYKSGVPVVVMAGRFHYYEGYSAAEITFPIRVLKALGVEKMILTNAAGGINPHFNEGDIVQVTDHINLMPEHPLRGFNDERLGLRFPDMLQAYDAEMVLSFGKIADTLGLSLKQGVYLGLQGPSLETPAEYKMARIMGADILGMSTIPEVIVAKHAGIKVAVFSIVSNVCFPKSAITETTVEAVIATVMKSVGRLQLLFDAYFERMKGENF